MPSAMIQPCGACRPSHARGAAAEPEAVDDRPDRQRPTPASAGCVLVCKTTAAVASWDGVEPHLVSRMARNPSRYAIRLLLAGGHEQTVHFPDLDAFQQWYGTVLNAGSPEAFINVPITELPGEYLVVRPGSLHAIRVEPIYGGLDPDA